MPGKEDRQLTRYLSLPHPLQPSFLSMMGRNMPSLQKIIAVVQVSWDDVYRWLLWVLYLCIHTLSAPPDCTMQSCRFIAMRLCLFSPMAPSCKY